VTLAYQAKVNPAREWQMAGRVESADVECRGALESGRSSRSSGCLPAPDVGDFAEHKWLRCSTGAQLGIIDCRRPDSAKFDELQPKRFYLREDPEQR